MVATQLGHAGDRGKTSYSSSSQNWNVSSPLALGNKTFQTYTMVVSGAQGEFTGSS